MNNNFKDFKQNIQELFSRLIMGVIVGLGFFVFSILMQAEMEICRLFGIIGFVLGLFSPEIMNFKKNKEK